MLLSIEDVQRLFDATGNPKHRCLLMTIYGAGLRVSEVVRLRPEHIENDRMMIRVEQQGKGMKDHYTLLPESLLLPGQVVPPNLSAASGIPVRPRQAGVSWQYRPSGRR